MSVPITQGTGASSVAAEVIGGLNYQQVKIADGTGGSTNALIVNSDGTLNARISGSVATAGGTFTGSVSGTVGASIIGTVPVVQSGMVITSVSGVVNIAGSVAAFQQGTIISSISGGISSVALVGANTVSVVGTLGASIVGAVPTVITSIATAGQVMGSVAVLQGTNPWIMTGSVQGSFTPSGNQSVSGTTGASVIGWVPIQPANTSTIGVIQGSVAVAIVSGSITATFTPPANQSVSGTVQVDVRGSVATVIIGGSIATATTNSSVMLLNGANTIGSVTTLQGTNPWVMTGSVQGTMSVLGTVPVTQSTTPWVITGSVQGSFSPSGNQSVSGTVGASVIGTVPVTQSGAWTHSVVGTVNVGSVIVGSPAIISTANSTTAPVTSTLSFTGTGEEWKDYGTITVNVFTDAISGTDGLSVQQSSDNANWDVRDAYTIPSMTAGQGKTFGFQPAARFGRIVYTQGPQNSGAFRLQTIYHPQYTKPSSQRASDAYTNETDLEQGQAFGMVFNGTTWDRSRGNSTNGTLVFGSVQAALTTGAAVIGSVATLQGTNPWIVTSSIAGGLFPISGSVAAVITNANVNVSGSVAAWLQSASASVITVPQFSSILAVPVGSTITVLQAASIVGTYAEDAVSASGDKGFLVMGARNDTLSSVTSNDGDYSSHVVGPSGELIAANAPFTKWISGTASMLGGTPVTGGSVLVIAAQGSSIFTYITGIQIANPSANNVWLKFEGATSSTLAFTMAPANGGSNIYFPNALKTNANGAFTASTSGVASIYVSAQGFIAKI